MHFGGGYDKVVTNKYKKYALPGERPESDFGAFHYFYLKEND